MARRARDVNLLRLAELLQEHITPALCHAAFGRVRKTERQRVWTLTALVQFWVAVILRAPKALSQALADGLEVRERSLGRFDLYAADAVFLTGTRAGIVPVGSLDSSPISKT